MIKKIIFKDHVRRYYHADGRMRIYMAGTNHSINYKKVGFHDSMEFCS